MICKTCGKENENGANFCVFCGSDLAQVAPMTQGVTSKEVKKSNNFGGILLENLNNLKNYLLKPLESKKSEDLKEVAIIGGILVVLMTLVNLLMTMINSVKTVSMDWLGNVSHSVDFSNLNNLDYLSIIFKNLFIYAVVMLAIAGIFYIGSLIIKKEVKFTKILSIVYVAAIPFFIGNVVVATILNLIYNPLAIIAIVISTIYSISIFAHLINNEIKLDGITKIYYNTACYSTIIIVIYFILMRIVLSTISSIGNMFGF